MMTGENRISRLFKYIYFKVHRKYVGAGIQLDFTAFHLELVWLPLEFEEILISFGLNSHSQICTCCSNTGFFHILLL